MSENTSLNIHNYIELLRKHFLNLKALMVTIIVLVTGHYF